MERILKQEAVPGVEVGIIFVDDDYIRDLSKTYASVDSVTDVLAFSMQEGQGGQFSHNLLGDVYISWDRAAEQARDHRVSMESELLRLAIHGILHLLGYDHEEKESRETMKEREEYFLKLALKRSNRSKRW